MRRDDRPLAVDWMFRVVNYHILVPFPPIDEITTQKPARDKKDGYHDDCFYCQQDRPPSYRRPSSGPHVHGVIPRGGHRRLGSHAGPQLGTACTSATVNNNVQEQYRHEHNRIDAAAAAADDYYYDDDDRALGCDWRVTSSFRVDQGAHHGWPPPRATVQSSRTAIVRQKTNNT